jgi:PadR family transcriptional regulator, regulatory protein PadR
MRVSHAGLMVLRVFIDNPRRRLYGFDLMQSTGVASGTLYPLLMRFEQQGWLTSSWEGVDPVQAGRPRRRLYRITGAGQRAAGELLNDVAPRKHTWAT